MRRGSLRGGTQVLLIPEDGKFMCVLMLRLVKK